MIMKHTFIEILTKINANLDKDKRWEKSKLRYYLREVLEEQPQKRGAESKYPDLTLNKLLFISKLMESSVRPSIRQLKEILATVSDDEINRIAAGTERLEIGVPDIDEFGTSGFRTINGEFISKKEPDIGRALVTSLSMFSFKENLADSDQDNSAADYMKKHFMKSAGATSSEKPGGQWKYLIQDPDLEIRFRKNLNRKQQKQLRLAGDLLRSIVSKED
jgi:hypothetical protein